MKKLMIFLMAALVLTGTLLVSCNQNVGEDKLSSVTISEDMARSLSTSITTNVKPVDQLTWYYKATKMDNGFFVTGQKTEWTELPTSAQGLVGQSLGQMSYGAWKFEFEGRDYGKPTATAAYTVEYYCDGLYETINKEETALTVPLKQGAAFDKAGIIFKDLIFTLNGVEVNDSVKIPSTGTGSTIGQVQLVITETGTENSWTFTGTSYVPATTDPAMPAYIAFAPASSDYFSYDTYSSHTYGFVVKYNDVAIMTPFAYTVYIELGYDMTISGDINAYEQKSDVTIEKTSESWTVQTAYTENTAVNPMVATTDATPAKLADATSTGKTTVNASVAALAAANGEIASGSTVANSVKVTVSSIETASVTFTATADNNAFAGIDLKLIKKVTTGTESVTSEVENANFGTNNPVTVETYIAKGLTNVVLTYPADTQAAQPTLVDYDPLTGRLVFTTTHFSEFAVFADQYIFDKTTNMAYKLDDDGLLDGSEFNDDHEYILLDPAKANLVSDDIDVFNASKSNWTVLHDSSDVENTTDFAGGYGTKIEPYLIGNRGHLENLGKWFGNGAVEFDYYKVKDGVSEIDCSDWNSVYLHGSFDGNNVVIKNLDWTLFSTAARAYDWKENKYVTPEKGIIKNITLDESTSIISTGWVSALVRTSGTNNLIFENVIAHGYIEGSTGVSTFVCFGLGNFSSSYADLSNFKFVNCFSDMTIVATSGNAVGFVAHPMATAQSTIAIKDSKYVGRMSATALSACKYVVGNWYNGAITASYSETYEPPQVITTTNGWSYNEQTKRSALSVESGSLPSSIGDIFSVEKIENAKTAVVSLIVAPNGPNETGNFVNTWLKEDAQLDGGNWVSDTIKYFTIRINPENVDETGIHGDFFDIVSSSYGHTVGSNTTARIVQYDENGGILKITNFSFNDKDTVGK